jgi:hypothetical protein
MSNGKAQSKFTDAPLALIFIGYLLEMKFIKLRFSEIMLLSFVILNSNW